MNMSELRRPQFASDLFPQAAFMITSMPVDDPLLSRISVDPSALPFENNGGWRLRADVQQSWKRLEKGLWLISDLLLDGLANDVSQVVRAHESWDRPQDFGYLEVFRSEYAARRAARQAHKSFLFLAARCSLAVACYQTAHGHHAAVGAAPPWLTFLTERNVPPSWLDGLHRSVVTQFSHGTRAGVAIDLPRCTWPHLIPVIKQARIPLFMYWENEKMVKAALSLHKFAQLLVPHRSDWEQVLIRGPPPCTRDGRFHLYHHGQVRIHPEDIDDPSRPPHGPYQRPGERLQDFLTRQKRKQDELRRREAPEQKCRRAEREAHANSGLPPGARTRVYVWMRLGDALPAAPLLWHDKPYRMPVAPSAVRGLWAVQPARQRHYNSFVDEWDMWLPPSRWLERHDALDGSLAELPVAPEDEQDPTTSTGSYDAPDLNDSVHAPAEAIATRPARQTLQADVENLEEDLRSLYPSSEEWAQRVFIRFCANFVEEWYGFRSPYPRTTQSANTSVIKYLHGVLGITEKAQPFEREVRVALAACVTAVLARNTDSDVLKTSWDLHAAGSGGILRNRRHIRWCKEAIQDVSSSGLFLVRFAKDATSLPWTLVLSGPALVCLLRRGNIEDSHAAIRELVLCGIAFNTVLLQHASHRIIEVPREPDVLDCRVEGYAAGIQDYGAYMVRLLEVLQRPHARAGLMKGGIVWRLMVEAVGNDSDMRERFLGYVHDGPSGDACEQGVFKAEGREYLDDDLSRAELDVICGTYLTFTGRGEQKASLSWWPPHDVWTSSGMYTGIWTPCNEDWFSTRLAEIYQGNATPKNYKTWKNTLKLHSETRKLEQAMQEASRTFIETNLVRGHSDQ